MDQTISDLVWHNKGLLDQYRQQFQQVFGAPLSKFMHPLFGFDIVRFDEWLKTPDGTSTADYLKQTKGETGYNLIASLI